MAAVIMMDDVNGATFRSFDYDQKPYKYGNETDVHKRK